MLIFPSFESIEKNVVKTENGEKTVDEKNAKKTQIPFVCPTKVLI